ncbi:hypothetical protein JCM17844_11970 [Iodidimonas gelatinilytica]|uniref:Uncharacterized protein n=1 Tax=Iodidimonas gelatinilytica TaxID=1236966 RepID=A0A5A7MNJ0_9PROT|nr:amidohydrolase family protein [Iodidimonas gelatinilytica]GEQ97560.1 hypothetical protein JCM17844_11970 [Iodidimonas gelatinilytica]
MTASRPEFDLIIRGAMLFDGGGGVPHHADMAISNGRVARIADKGALEGASAVTVVDGSGHWLMPGLLDIHTHFDLEAEIAPALPEAVRHGSTTVVVANCSLGLAFGNQRTKDQDPIVDCFARVENIPKHILRAVADKAVWQDSGAYLAHLEHLPLGPNLVPLLPHSMLRIEVMGLSDSIRRDPTDAEIARMEALLEKAMEEGYAGFSTDALPFHYLANRPNERSRIPAQYGRFEELKRLTNIVRRHDRLWQATPPKDSPLQVFRTFALSSGRLYGKPLKLTAVAAIDIATNKSIVKLGRFLSRFLNSKLMAGQFRFQALAAPFRVWAEGPLTPLAEEIPSLRRLNEPDLEDRKARLEILRDPQWRKQFKAMWFHGKTGWSLARLKRLLQREDYAISRDLADMVVDRCPVPDWAGESLAEIYDRLMGGKAGRSGKEQQALDRLAPLVADEADFLIALFEHFDTELYWSMISANRDPKIVRDLVMDPKILPGFNDSGAHLTNMAFYDGNLRALQIAQKEGVEAVAYMVRRLTKDPADFFGVDAGSLEIGARADLVLIDPDALAAYDSAAQTYLIDRAEFGHHQLVNRSDGVVPLVAINGRIAWQKDRFAPELGKDTGFGRPLRAKSHAQGVQGRQAGQGVAAE